MRIEIAAGDRLEVAVAKGGGTVAITGNGVSYREPNGKNFHGPIPLDKLPALARVFVEDDANDAS